jgi:hypothetical protein
LYSIRSQEEEFAIIEVVDETQEIEQMRRMAELLRLGRAAAEIMERQK